MHIFNVKFIVAFFTAVLVTALPLGYAAEEKSTPREVGAVVVLEGDVYVKRPGTQKWLRVTPQTPFYEGDEIKCEKGRVRIALKGGAVISLSEGARFRLDTHTEKRAVFKLIKGKVFSFFARVSRTLQSLKIFTPSAVVGVRGTRFIVSAQETDTGVWVIEGEVEVRSLAREAESEALKIVAGMKTYVKQGQPPSPPEEIPADELRQLLQQFVKVDPEVILKNVIREARIESEVENALDESDKALSNTRTEGMLPEEDIPPVEQEPVPSEKALEGVKVKMRYR